MANLLFLSPRQQQQFEADGYVVVEDWLSPSELATLRAEADKLLETTPLEAVARRGCVFETTAAGGAITQDAFLSARRVAPAAVSGILFGGKLQATAGELLQPVSGPLCLFNEQYIVKPPYLGGASAFAWHRDGQWQARGDKLWAGAVSASLRTDSPATQPQDRPRYISMWCALDDVSEDNGASCACRGTQSRVAHASLPFVFPITRHAVCAARHTCGRLPNGAFAAPYRRCATLSTRHHRAGRHPGGPP
jgi:ectoine hydroxylase-related dioxygenase (phytanoyl-CoA dioxygenase family)